MQERNESLLSLRVRSDSFGANGTIPMEHAVEGDNAPPHLAWSEVPAGTRSIVVMCEDPDAPTRTFVHWIVVGIPPDVRELDGDALPEGAALGTNDAGEQDWMGPNPPNGRHRYFFKVFALDIGLESPGLTKYEVYAAMKGHVLARGELVGTYEKQTGFARGPRANMPSGQGAHGNRERR